ANLESVVGKPILIDVFDGLADEEIGIHVVRIRVERMAVVASGDVYLARDLTRALPDATNREDNQHPLHLCTLTATPRRAPVRAAAEPSRTPSSMKPELPRYASGAPCSTSPNVRTSGASRSPRRTPRAPAACSARKFVIKLPNRSIA